MKINEIIVVEGRDDTVRVKAAVECDTIETNGSAINKETLDAIKLAAQKRGVIVLTDPDYPGNKIRKTIEQYVPEAKQAFIHADDAKNKKGKIGVEHASLETIRAALQNVSTPRENEEKTVSQSFLVDCGLIVGTDAAKKRAELCRTLNIGHCNGKQLLNRLNAFGITEADIISVLKEDSSGI